MVSVDSGKPILVIEGDEIQSNAILRELAVGGFSPIRASDIHEAKLKLENQRFACIVLDIDFDNEPSADHIEMLKPAKLILNHMTPILVIGANFGKGALRGMVGRIQGVMEKPLDPGKFVAHVQGLAR